MQIERLCKTRLLHEIVRIVKIVDKRNTLEPHLEPHLEPQAHLSRATI